jgi:hypothetical protein
MTLKKENLQKKLRLLKFSIQVLKRSRLGSNLPRLNLMLIRKKILKLKIKNTRSFIYDYTFTYTYTYCVKIPSQISDIPVKKGGIHNFTYDFTYDVTHDITIDVISDYTHTYTYTYTYYVKAPDQIVFTSLELSDR